MIQKLKLTLLSISSLLISSLTLLAPAAVLAQGAEIQDKTCGGASSLQIDSTQKCSDTSGSVDSFNHILTVVINIFSVIVGVVAVIMIIIGGFRYITSGGSTERVTGAKNTILYAIIGLVIVALAQIIVKFVLNKATSES
jgi:hypothetical protein